METKHYFTKNFFLAMITLLSAIVIATVTMFLVYCIPTDSIKSNVFKSLNVYIMEKDIYRWAPTHISTKGDNWGDAYLLLKALYPPENALQDSMLSPRFISNRNTSAINALFNYFLKQSDVQRFDIPRYWSGSLILLKPLLTIFTVSDIRMINMILQIFLLCLLVIQLYLKGGYKLLLPFLVGVLILNPITLALSIIWSFLYYITLLSCLILLKYNLYSSPKYWYFFFLIGICSVFFDQFTYILVPLGFPLILFILLNSEKMWPKMKKVIMASISWGIGFIGMWMGKWCVGSLITGKNFFLDAYNQAKYRSGNEIPIAYDNILPNPDIESFTITFWDAIWKNLLILCNSLPEFLYFAVIVWTILYLLVNKFKAKFKTAIVFPLLLIACYPFGYCLILRNAAFTHAWGMYRLFSLTVLALIYIIVYSLEKEPKPISSKKEMTK